MKEWWQRHKVIMEDPELRKQITENSTKLSCTFKWFQMFAGTNPMTYHKVMFTRGVMQLGSVEQAQHYESLMNHWQVIGCYAQTELGHGSDVAGLETTAELDMKTDEFVIHTPSIKAIKFWPGNLSVQANHAIVFARCIADGSDYGVQPFLV